MQQVDFVALTKITSAEIRFLEQVTFNALPALRTFFVDGWVVRLANQYTRRANSVNPIFTPHENDTRQQIKACESIYSAHNQDTIFKMTVGVQPSNLEEILDEQDYQPTPDYTLVQTCNLNTFSDFTEKNDVQVQIDTQPSQGWFDAYCTLNNLPKIHRSTMWQILQSISLPINFIRLEIDQEIVAVALGVCEQDYVGLFDFVVVEKQRRQGLGSYLLQNLMYWGKKQGANTAYLQVVGTNYPAQALYDKYGFATVYAYWYRRKSSNKLD